MQRLSRAACEGQERLRDPLQVCRGWKLCDSRTTQRTEAGQEPGEIRQANITYLVPMQAKLSYYCNTDRISTARNTRVYYFLARALDFREGLSLKTQMCIVHGSLD